MHRHRFDPVSIVIGAVFVAAAIIVLAGGRLVDEGRILLPIGLVAFGAALLGQASHPRDAAAAPAAPVEPARPAEPAAPMEPAAPVATAPPVPPAEPEPDPTLPRTEEETVEDRSAAGGPGADFYFGTGWQPERRDPDTGDGP